MTRQSLDLAGWLVKDSYCILQITNLIVSLKK